MSDQKLSVLERALAREKAARKQAEKILEQKSAELYSLTEELKKSNDQLEDLVQEKTSELRGVFENIVDVYVVMDLKGNFLRRNDAADELFELSPDMHDVNVVNLIYSEDYGYAMKSYTALIENGYFTNYKARIITTSKKIRWVHINASLIYDSENRPIAAQGIVRDITESREIALLIEDQKQKLGAIVDHSSLGIVLTQEGKIIQSNKAAREMLHYSELEMLELQVKDISLKDDFPASAEYMEKMNSNQLDNFVIEKRYVRKGGSNFWSKTNVTAIRNEDGSIKYQLAMMEDITELKKNEEDRKKLLDSLEAQKEKYSSIIANMNLGLLEVDNDDTILLVNQSFLEMSGYEEDELIGEKAAELLLTQEDNTRILEENKKRTLGQSNSYEVIAKTKSNETRNWLVSGAPNYDINGKIIGSIGIHLDITELKTLEAQKEVLLENLERNNIELQEYAHIVSHDLKSPLRSIYALVDWIKEDNKNTFDNQTQENFGLIEQTLEKMEALIMGILNYSSINAESQKKEKVDLNTIIADVYNTVLIPEHILIYCKNLLPTIKGDKVQLQQLFQNLIGNAIEHIDKDEGRVEIDFVEKPNHFEFSISDNGVGIKKEYHQKIFGIFQSLSEKKKSTGIGLSIVKKIVDLHNGRIWLESQVGEGTTFYFTLKKN